MNGNIKNTEKKVFKMLNNFKIEMNEITDSYSDYMEKNYVSKKDHDSVLEILEKTILELKMERKKNRELEIERNYLKKNNNYMKVLLKESNDLLKKVEEAEYKKLNKIEEMDFLGSFLDRSKKDPTESKKIQNEKKEEWKSIEKKPKNKLRRLIEQVLESKLDQVSSKKDINETYYNVNLYS